MASTNLKSDTHRISRDLELLTELGRYQLSAPGPGSNVGFQEDPFIRIQKHGANLRTNTINLESNLMGLSQTLNNDCLELNNYKNNKVESSKVTYTSNRPGTDQSRSTHPAWMYKDLEQVNWSILPLNPQEHTCIPFHNNLSSRILEKDYWSPKVDCIDKGNNTKLPHKNFMSGNNNCVTNNNCVKINN